MHIYWYSKFTFINAYALHMHEAEVPFPKKNNSKCNHVVLTFSTNNQQDDHVAL